MAFQLTPLQIPNLTTNYGAENQAFSNLGQTLGNLPGDIRKEQLQQQKQQLLGSLNSGTPDYAKVGMGLVALGDTQGGAALIGLGQKQQQLGAQSDITKLFSGGSTGVSVGGNPPTGSGVGLGVGNGAQAARPYSRPVQVAESEDDTQRLEAEMERRAQLGYGNTNLPAGMRNNNPGNIKFVSQSQAPGVVGPSQNTDQGDPQAVFNSPEAGMSAAYDLALRKYQGGKRTALDLIAGQGGWTPGNTGAAANIARSMGISPTDDLGLNDPQRAQSFMRALIAQEHGKSGGLYDGGMIASAVTGSPGSPVSRGPVQVAQAPAGEDPQSDVPAPGAAYVTGPGTTQAAQAQGFAVPGTSLPPNDPFPKIATQKLYEVWNNPLSSDGQKAMAKSIIDARQKYSDENAPDKREQQRLTTQKLRNEVEGDATRSLITPEERAQYGVDPSYKGTVQLDRSGKLTFPGKASTEVNVNSGEKTYDQTVGKAQGEYFVATQQGGRDARDQITTLKRMQSVMDSPDFFSGWNGGRATAFKKLAVALGVKDAESAAPNELFDKLSKQAVLDKAGGSFGSGFSNGDRDYIDATTANINNTPEGNKQIIDMALKVAQRRVDASRMARDYAKANGGRLDGGFDEQMADYAEKNPLFTQPARRQQSAPAAPPPAQPVQRPTGNGSVIISNPKTGQRMMLTPGNTWEPFDG